jgi:hypothetical protein
LLSLILAQKLTSTEHPFKLYVLRASFRIGSLYSTLTIQLAANGPSILTKIRLVAVTLLDAVPAQAYDDPSVQGMAAYLLGEH